MEKNYLLMNPELLKFKIKADKLKSHIWQAIKYAPLIFQTIFKLYSCHDTVLPPPTLNEKQETKKTF